MFSTDTHSQCILITFSMYTTFFDFKKAFESIDREMMFAILCHYGIPSETVNAIRIMYCMTNPQVYIGREHSKSMI